MRRLLSFVLLLVFGLPVVAPAFGATANAETSLPACCRRNGAHHCVMTPEQIEALRHGTQFNAVRSKCPFCPSTPIGVHYEVPALQRPSNLHVSTTMQQAQFRQAEAWARVAMAGARYKRGPPQNLL